MSLAAAALMSCSREPAEPPAANVQTEAPLPQDVPRAPAVPVPPPALTRGDLISAAAQAASAYAEGKPRPTADPLVARSFAVRLPFGCTGPSPAAEPASQAEGVAAWTWGPDHRSIQLRMTPGDWLGSAMLAGAGALDKWEAVEGFWIPRPWLASEACPAVRADPLQTDAAPASPQTVGLAAVFEAGGSRLSRRNGRAYEYTIRAKGDAPLVLPQNGFRMLLEGRVAAFPTGGAIECRAAGPDQRPVCIIAVKLDRVTYEDADGTTLSEWRAG